jgi:uncharacterized protein YdeI (YjbR/CyaY-like superfamily)
MAQKKLSGLAVLGFATQSAWSRWLASHHASTPGVWIQLAKKGSGSKSVTYAEAVEVALCFGWIDGQGRSKDELSWLQKFTPRRKRSSWSKINRARALELIASGRMQPPGLAEIRRAKQDGRWKAAYDSPKRSTVPDDLRKALAKNTRARAFFAELNAANRYAVLYRIQTAKKPETRARRIAEFVKMLARRETLHR